MAVLGGAALPRAAAATPSDTTTENVKPAVEQVCDQPQPGQFGCFALRRADPVATRSLEPDATAPSGWGAQDLQGAYGLPSDGGAGRTIAIVDAYDDPTAEFDLARYRAQFGLPACSTANGCFRMVDQRGGSEWPATDEGWSGEISLDLDMVSAAAPAAHILLVEADSPDFEDMAAAVDEAVALGAQYVSNSYGSGYSSTPGSGEDPAETTEMDAHYNHPGVAMIASSGDSAYGVSYPAASQYVTAVGGTSLKKDASTGRGWSESVWHSSSGGPGSGCSAYEPKPAFQGDTGCDQRTVADVSAVADPATGVAVFQSFGGNGWEVYGGTSASSPIIAGVYADAGAPAAGTYPNSYPYLNPSSLNDVTSGSNGTCTPSYLCTAGPGYDGPTGLGTPNGLAAFRTGPHGQITGTVTDAAGAAVAGAGIAAGDYRATTRADGHYSLTLAPGTYDLTVSAFGYADRTATGVVVGEDGSVTENFALDAVARQTVAGKVTDGSGHGWPLYARITVDGTPAQPVFTDPFTGSYAVDLPQGKSYTLKIDAQYPGYREVTEHVTVAGTAQTVNAAVPVDIDSGTAKGYDFRHTGPTEPFDSTTSAPDGWSVVNADGTAGSWDFSDPHRRGNHTGGTGAFAIVDSDFYGYNKHQDSSLVTPVYDFSGDLAPEIAFDTDYKAHADQTASVDITTDGGATWKKVWAPTAPLTGPAHVQIPLTDYAGDPAVQLRFHFTGTWGWWWQVDDVHVGDRLPVPATGGLVAGTVTDGNTGNGVVGATVTNTDATGQSAVTAATPDDPGLGDGFYWMFSDTVGKHAFTAEKGRYTTRSKTVQVAADSATEVGYALDAGRLSFTPGGVDQTLAWGAAGTTKVKVENTGKAPATLDLGEASGGFTMQTAKGAPLQLVKGHYSALRPDHLATRATVAPGAAGDAWQTVADLPVPLMDNAVAAGGGVIYSAFGWTGSTESTTLYAYDTVTGSWSARAPSADGREAPAAGFIDGKLYAVGGWGSSGQPDTKLEIYDPVSDRWTTGASAPVAYAGSGSAVLDGKLYVVGGCTMSACGTEDAYVYDPSDNSWSAIASYPEAVAWSACGGIGGTLYCAGGETSSGTTTHGYAYNPDSNRWSPIADLPIDVWGSAYTTANGMLLTSGGVVDGSTAITNQGFAFDPSTGVWTALPNADTPLYRGGGAPGFYTVGGNTGAGPVPVATVRLLPGYDQASADVTWLSLGSRHAVLAPGESTTVTVALDASAAGITQPGAYTAKLNVTTDTPYQIPAIPVTMTVNPPKTWGKYTGTVLGTDGKGGTAPLAGATVEIDSWASSYTLKTRKDGTYGLWLDTRNNPLTVIVARDGYKPTTTTVKIKKGTTTTGDFTLTATS
ncbi:carboxypeptidase regulatory-like domain-containing protein [Streptomyces sp. NRRL F-5123]|uniref:carboxypeptidase regulatory-like domain-containing protein n=1 Tax=Streptomyces sp. NRRL F-5123 TaxID=1463856 RepID=UPI0004E160F9